MDKSQIATQFMESFDPSTFNKYDYAFSGTQLKLVDDYLKVINANQKTIDKYSSIIESGGVTGTTYAKSLATQQGLLNKWESALASFLKRPTKNFSAQADAVTKSATWLAEAKAANKSSSIIKRAEERLQKDKDKLANTLAREQARLEGLIAGTKKEIQEIYDKEVAYAQKQIPELQEANQTRISKIAQLHSTAQTEIQNKLATGLEYIVDKLDSIDKATAAREVELTGKGAQNGIDLDYVAARDKDIADRYADINERIGTLTNFVGNYGAKVPEELLDPTQIREFYDSAKGQVTEDNPLSSVLSQYVNTLLFPEQRDQLAELNKDGAWKATDEDIAQAKDIVGATDTYIAPPPASESEEVLQMYAANPQAEKVVKTAEELAAEREQFWSDFDERMSRIGERDTSPLPGSQEYYQMTQAPDYVGASGLTREQANDLARQFLLYGNFQFVNEKGVPIINQVPVLSDEILNKGWEATFERISPDANFAPISSSTYIDRAVAEQFARDLMIRGGYSVDEGQVTSWANTIQSRGFDEGAKSFVSTNPGLSGSPLPNAQDMTNYINANKDIVDGLLENSRTTFDENVAKILAGEDFNLAPKNVDRQTYVDFVTNSRNLNQIPEDQRENIQQWISSYDALGSEGAIAQWNMLNPDRPMPFSEPQQPFQPDITGEGTTTPDTAFEPDIYGTGTETPSPTTPTTPTTTPPTTTTGAPGFAFRPGEISGYTPTTMQPSEEPPLFGEETTFQPAPYTPPPLLTAPPPSPTLSPAQQVIGAPAIERPVGAPMQPLTPEQAGAQFVEPTQEDYFAYFGYTPEQLNAAQYLAELEGAPRAGVAAQTVPVLPPAVSGATAPTGMRKGGMPQDAQRLANQGRGGDSMLVHMAPEEVAGLQALASQFGTSLTVNPRTGLPEAIKLKDFLGPVVALGASVLTGGAVSPLTASLAFGGGYAVGSGSLEKGLMAGIGAYTGANLLSAAYTGVTGTALPGYTLPPAAGAGAAGAGNAATKVASDLGGVATAGSSGTAAGTTATLEAMGTSGLPEKTLVERATDYLQAPSTVPTTANSIVGNVLGYTTTGEMSKNLELAEQMEAQAKQDAATQAAILAREDEKNRRLFETTLGAVPVRSGGLIALAGGGMTYAEGGGTTGPTNEPRMVKGTGDGMSDSVPATIEGVQEARLANDEFVIPADVVADLGNGSSSAGAQQLYDMMDRIRQARHGTTEQPPEINARKLMPA